MEEFVERGWAVVDLKPPAGIQPPVPEADKSKIKDLQAQSKAAWDEVMPPGQESKVANIRDQRFNKWREIQAEISRLESGSFQVCPGTDLNEVAPPNRVDHRPGSCRVGLRDRGGGGLLTAARRPDLPQHPMVAVGFTRHNRDADGGDTVRDAALDAVVLIGGGADAFFLSQHSSFTDGGVRVRCGKDKVAPEVIDRLDELYIQHSKLDPYYTAPLLRGLPMLVVDARGDTWVPAAGGELLFDRLGRPDRLTIGADHDLLFYFLPWKAGVIADWLEGAVGEVVMHRTDDTDEPRLSSRGS